MQDRTIHLSILNIRKQPTTSADIIGQHARGDTVVISAKTNNGWYRVDYPNIGTGYISGDYVTVSEIKTEPPVVETPAPVKPPKPVIDNTPDAWAADSVNAAKAKGILQGDENGNLQLHSDCTRQDIIVFLYRLYQKI